MEESKIRQYFHLLLYQLLICDLAQSSLDIISDIRDIEGLVQIVPANSCLLRHELIFNMQTLSLSKWTCLLLRFQLVCSVSIDAAPIQVPHYLSVFQVFDVFEFWRSRAFHEMTWLTQCILIDVFIVQLLSHQTHSFNIFFDVPILIQLALTQLLLQRLNQTVVQIIFQ